MVLEKLPNLFIFSRKLWDSISSDDPIDEAKVIFFI